MTTMLQDPHILIYDNLFFRLSLGKCDIRIFKESEWFTEEYVLVRPVYQNRLVLLKDILSSSSDRLKRSISKENGNFIEKSGQFIQFINYSDITNRELIGLGLRITSNSKISPQILETLMEDRIQKIMFLLSRGMLKSQYHRIDYLDIEIMI